MPEKIYPEIAKKNAQRRQSEEDGDPMPYPITRRGGEIGEALRRPDPQPYVRSSVQDT
jgi:hypothetical protein